VYLSFLTLAVFPLTVWLKWRATGTLSPKLVALWFMAGIAYPIMFIFAGFGRLVQTAPLGYILGTLQVWWLVEWLKGHATQRVLRIGARACAAGFALLPVAFLLYGLTENDMYFGSVAIRLNRNTLLTPPHARLYETSENAQAAREVVAHVLARTRPQDRIFASYDHAFYFLTGRQNPTGIYFFPAHLETDPQLLERFLGDLRDHPPKVLIRRTSEVRNPAEDRAWWQEYISHNFELAFQNEFYVVYDGVQAK
jgi:hypothetical protein